MDRNTATGACLAAMMLTAWTAPEAEAEVGPLGQFTYAEPTEFRITGTLATSKPLDHVYFLYTSNNCSGVPAEVGAIKLPDAPFANVGNVPVDFTLTALAGYDSDNGGGVDQSVLAFTIVGLYHEDGVDHVSLLLAPSRAQLFLTRSFDSIFSPFDNPYYPKESEFIAMLNTGDTEGLRRFAHSPMQNKTSGAQTWDYYETHGPISQSDINGTFLNFSNASLGGTAILNVSVVPEPVSAVLVVPAFALLRRRR